MGESIVHMLPLVLRAVVMALGVALVLLSTWGILFPRPLMGAVRAVVAKPWGLAFGVTIRLALGVSLLLSASTSKVPLLFTVLGSLILASAILLLVMGPARLQAVVERVCGLSVVAMRAVLTFGALLGACIVYGVSPGV